MNTPFQPSGRPRTVAIDERRGLNMQSLVPCILSLRLHPEPSGR